MKKTKIFLSFLCLGILFSCKEQTKQSQTNDTLSASDSTQLIKPFLVTDSVQYDSDDPAIWIDNRHPDKSIIVGTDKNEDGALYAYDLEGKIIANKVVKGLKRPNNVDVEYGLLFEGKKVDVAVVTERLTHKLRIFSMPDMKPIDNGGIPVFEGEPEDKEFRDLMGISLYKNEKSQKIYAIVGRKNGTSEGYLWQYLLEDGGKGNVKATLVRKFGKFSKKKEIESIAVDDELGFVYYSDETVGVRKYYADPEKGNQELSLFATSGFTQDHEGISIYDLGNGKGYILVSDQEANQFYIFSREGDNKYLKTIKVNANHSDGSETISLPLNKNFPHGLFVAMSDNKTFEFYKWEDIAGKDLKSR